MNKHKLRSVWLVYLLNVRMWVSVKLTHFE